MADLQELLDTLLPEELQAEIDRRKEIQNKRIRAITSHVEKRIAEAIKARTACGIEVEWTLAEDQYNGIDDANRTTERYLKPATPDGALTTATTAADVVPTKSTIYLNITRPYTDAAASRIADMLFPTDDRNWGLRPTPVPEMIDALEDYRPVEGAGETTEPLPSKPGEPIPPSASPGQPTPAQAADGGLAQAPRPRPVTVADLAKKRLEQAERRAKLAEEEIEDNLAECQYASAVRKVIMDWARLGTGVLKGPVPVRRRAKKVEHKDGNIAVVVANTIKPASCHVSPWDFFPAPGCGENIHDGEDCSERDRLSGRRLHDLIGLPGYNAARIRAALLRGPDNTTEHIEGDYPDRIPDALMGEMYTVWYYYGELSETDFKLLDLDEDDIEGLFNFDFESTDGDRVPVMVTLVNGEAIRISRNPLDSGEFPYDVVCWQERPGLPYGYGVPYQIRPPQRMAVAAARNMMDNAGLAGGPIIVVDQELLEPVDDNWVISARKIFRSREGMSGRDLSKALIPFNIPMMQEELMGIIQFALKMAEDVTGLPMILQGQLGKAPDTVGGMQMLQNNASSVVRRLAKLFDDRFTEPHIGRYYEWLLLFGENDEAKGDLQIDARGSSTLVERDIQNMEIAQLLAFSKDPAFDLSPARCMEEYLRSRRFDPSRFKPTDQEREALANKPQPEAPQITAAKIRAQVDLQRAQLDTDRDTAYVQAQTAKVEADHTARMAELELKRELAMLDYANRRDITLEQVRADLAKKAADINLTRELAHVKARADLLPTPPVEPPGRAPAGESFTM